MNFGLMLSVGIGGFLGAISRWIISTYINKTIISTIPLGTVMVNLAGSLIMGILFAYFSNYELNPNIKLFLTTGFLGALTTFSTFAIESVMLFEKSFWFAILNMSINLIGSVLFAGVGYKLCLMMIK